MDVRTVVHRTVLWFTTWGFVIIPVVLCFWLLDPWVHSSQVREIGLLILLSLGLLAYARHMQPRVDHYFQRRRYDLYQTVQRLADGLVPLKGIGEVYQNEVGTVREVLYADPVFAVVV